VLWAATVGKQQELLEAMYSAYFEKSEALFTREDLIAVSAKVGISTAEVNSVLDSAEFASQVDEDQQLAHSLGANGVPFFVIDMKIGISGAQPQEVFDQALEQALAQ
jgi:predicted DsbA family dithiol-disulfide isomerase